VHREVLTNPIRYEWPLWAVRIKRKHPAPNVHPYFLSSARDSPVALFFQRYSAVEHADGLVAEGFEGVSVVRVHVKIDQVRQPSARGMKKSPPAEV
jgi:hypothetical protein